MQIAKILRPIVLGLILCASHARTFSLINGYGAPIEAYKILEHHDDVGKGEALLFPILLMLILEFEIALLKESSYITLIFRIRIVHWK